MKSSKKDQIKETIMTFLNEKVGSVARTEINKEVESLGSERTIRRSLAELKDEGKITFQKDEKTKDVLWTSTEPLKRSDEKSDQVKIDDNPIKTEDIKPDAESVKKTEKTEPKSKAKAKKNEDNKSITGKSDKKRSTKKSKAKKDPNKKAKKDSEKKPGVIDIIIKSISKKPRTKKQILNQLIKKFPERDPEKMMKTINVQVPTRLRTDKGVTLKKSKKGYVIVKN